MALNDICFDSGGYLQLSLNSTVSNTINDIVFPEENDFSLSVPSFLGQPSYILTNINSSSNMPVFQILPDNVFVVSTKRKVI